MKRVLLGLMLSMLSLSSWAVDGYKGVLFGASVKDVLNTGLCSFQETQSNSEIKELSLYTCSDFTFSGKKTMAMATFLNGKFKRLLIDVNSNINPLLDALSKKYGSPSSMSEQSIMERAITTGEPVLVYYDNNTVVITVRKVNNKEIIHLIYTDHEFDNELRALSQKAIASDI